MRHAGGVRLRCPGDGTRRHGGGKRRLEPNSAVLHRPKHEPALALWHAAAHTHTHAKEDAATSAIVAPMTDTPLGPVLPPATNACSTERLGWSPVVPAVRGSKGGGSDGDGVRSALRASCSATTNSRQKKNELIAASGSRGGGCPQIQLYANAAGVVQTLRIVNARPGVAAAAPSRGSGWPQCRNGSGPVGVGCAGHSSNHAEHDYPIMCSFPLLDLVQVAKNHDTD
eukprot:4337471-Pleurochrysis_carterae.AAC.2